MPDNSERSGIHRQVERYLEREHLNFVSEAQFPPYQVDIYLPEWHLAVEIDGPFHLQKHDRFRDQVLRDTYGLLVLRIGYKHLSRDKVMRAVKQFIEQNADSTQRRIQLA